MHQAKSIRYVRLTGHSRVIPSSVRNLHHVTLLMSRICRCCLHFLKDYFFLNPITGLDRPWRFQQVGAPRFQDMKVVRLSALHTGRLYPQEIFLVLISVRGWVNPRAILWARRIMSKKNSNDTIGNQTRNLPVLAHCLNQLRHCIPLERLLYNQKCILFIHPPSIHMRMVSQMWFILEAFSWTTHYGQMPMLWALFFLPTLYKTHLNV
jgi:hypothetical protein